MCVYRHVYIYIYISLYIYQPNKNYYIMPYDMSSAD